MICPPRSAENGDLLVKSTEEKSVIVEDFPCLPGASEKKGEKKEDAPGGAQAGQAQNPDEEQKDTQLDRAVKYLKDSFLDKKMGA